MASCRIGNRYVGLTDDLERRKGEHGNPADWKHVKTFSSERDARAWEDGELKRPNTCGDTGGAGWKYGYEYTVTTNTRE